MSAVTDARVSLRRALTAAALGAAMILAAVAGPASAKVFKPTKLGDHTLTAECTAADCTLRDAVNAANVHAGPDTVLLKGGKAYRLSVPGTGEDTDVSGDLDVLETLTIRSSNRRRAMIDATGRDRVLDTPGLAGRLTLDRLNIVDGDAGAAAGGGVLARGGTLQITRSTLGNNQAGNFGGGVYVAGGTTATISKTTLERNSGDGGALAIGPSSSAKLVASTVDRNKGGNGAGIFVGLGGGAALTVVNSTIANNRAQLSGGGIAAASSGVVELRNVTVARNVANTADVAQEGGGIAELSTGPIVVRNSIIALNRVAGTTGAGPDCDFSAYVQSEGRNLVSDDQGCGGFAGPPNILTGQPRLGRLFSRGGPTETIALQKGSKAIDHAGAGATKRDQRGRKRDGKPDIGAFERR